MVLSARVPMCVAWGPSLVQLYNDAYAAVLGAEKHRTALGGLAQETFAESWDRIGPAFEQARAGTNGTGIQASHEPGSTFFFGPVPDDDGSVGGVLVTVAGSAADRNLSFVQGGGECGALIRAFDWSTTCLGAMSAWPQSLRTSVSTMLRSPYPIILFWARDRVMLYNDPFRPILGEKHPGTVGASGREALAEAWEILGPLMDRVLATGEPLFIENGAVFFARMPGGQREEAYFTWSYNPTIGEDGEIAGLFAIASETTAQVVGDRRLAVLRELSVRNAFDRQVQEAFRSIEEVLSTAGADLPFALFYVVDGERARLVSCAGMERGSAGAPLEILAGDENAWPLHRAAVDGGDVVAAAPPGVVLPGGAWPEPAAGALLLNVPIGADARTTGVLVAGVSARLPLNDVYRSFLQLLGRQISAGVSSARAYEEETRRAEKLAELDRAKTSFFSNVSHEFRTPLTLILGPLESACARPGATLGGEELDLVRRNAVRLHKMVNALLDFSRIEAGRAQATFVPTDLSTFTASLASHFRSAAESGGLALQVRCEALPSPVYVDPELWEKIAFNLLSNAIKYTSRGRIDVSLRADGADAVLEVADTGVGIGETDLGHVFDRFYRVHGSAGRSHEGTGIGLALARELVELHGGTVTAESKVGVGTTFKVRLPFGSAHLPSASVEHAPAHDIVADAAHAAPFVQEALRWTAPVEAVTALAEPTSLMPSSVTSARILVIDDNADLRAYVSGLLGPVFANVTTATNGAEGLERARATAPDLVISDVMMPVMDGFELVRALRSDASTQSIPIILLSARAGDESTVEGLDSGADDYLVKPFSARELLARVRTQLEMTRVRGEIWRERARVDTLLRSAAARDELLTVLAHELRTPLTTLELQLGGLLRAGAAGRELERVQKAMRQTERLTRLVEMLIDVSNAALGKLEVQRERVDLDALVRVVVGSVEAEAGTRGTTFLVESAPLVGTWDPRRLADVVHNLLTNAMKHAPGTEIEVSVRRVGERAELRVHDRGTGITPELMGRIFDRFERGGSVDHHGGFGVGLYLARHMVAAHGGDIIVESTSAEGTTFRVSLPVEQGA